MAVKSTWLYSTADNQNMINKCEHTHVTKGSFA